MRSMVLELKSNFHNDVTVFQETVSDYYWAPAAILDSTTPPPLSKSSLSS